MQHYSVAATNKGSLVITHKVLRNTYFLLSLTLLCSALTAYLAIISNARFLGPLATILGMFGLLFLTQVLRNSFWGIISTFAFTGFMGYVLAPTLSFYLHNFTNGGALILTALCGTGLIFFSLSAYTLISRRDFSFLGGFLFVAIMAAFIASLASLVFNLPVFQLLISGVFMLICSALIIFHTSAIIHGGETNYISATISLYVALLNIFVGLLNLLGAFSGNRK
jgi:modulator of FtsH protease